MGYRDGFGKYGDLGDTQGVRPATKIYLIKIMSSFLHIFFIIARLCFLSTYF